ncbi:MAG TPA: hypothetical protein VMY87_02220 [Armatimonadota bacterium]|nr:hypothetical protein [Armatimonadota bacterium]
MMNRGLWTVAFQTLVQILLIVMPLYLLALLADLFLRWGAGDFLRLLALLLVLGILVGGFRGGFRSVYLGNLMAQEFAKVNGCTTAEARSVLVHMDTIRVLLKADILAREKEIGRRLTDAEIREMMFSFFLESEKAV